MLTPDQIAAAEQEALRLDLLEREKRMNERLAELLQRESDLANKPRP